MKLAARSLGHGDLDRTLGQGLLIKAALATVQPLGIIEIPNLLSIMDRFVTTDLSVDDLLTLAATVGVRDGGTDESQLCLVHGFRIG